MAYLAGTLVWVKLAVRAFSYARMHRLLFKTTDNVPNI